MKKALPYILYSLLILVIVGLLVYQAFVTKDLNSGNLTRGILLLVGALFGMLKPKKSRQLTAKKALYQKSYPEFIQDPFRDDPKLETAFYKAVDDYNKNRPSAGIAKLTKLRKHCRNTGDLYAVTVFTALCCADMGAYEEALLHYRNAANIRNNSTLHSNAALCLVRLGRMEEAEESCRSAIACDEKNAFAWNNLSGIYFRRDDYEKALEYAETAISHNGQLPQALSTAAICCGILGREDDYRKYYRMAVSVGYDGNKIKKMVKLLTSVD